MNRAQAVTLLGSTGSIGHSALDVIARHPERFSVYALSANTNVDDLFQQVRTYQPQHAVMVDEAAAAELHKRCREAGLEVVVAHGDEALAQIASDADVDVVVAAIVGAAGLLPTLAAASAGKRLLLANKESLVMSGEILMQAASDAGALMMPVDSEHNAIFQSLPVQLESGKAVVDRSGIVKILLTASGGPLRTCTLSELSVVSPQQALKHPNWSMGPKISIDSATLMNKGLEVIEACHLFDVDVDDIDVVVHPQSIIHSMVSYRDGSVLAQMGRPDMRTPIAHALAWPDRIDAGVQPLDFSQMAKLEFEAPDTERFPALRLAFEAQRTGGTAPAILNAANEVAVAAFLDGSVAFLQLIQVVEETLSRAKISPAADLPTIIDADTEARQIARQLIRSSKAPSKTSSKT